MNIGMSTSVIGRGRTGIAQYVFGLIRAMVPCMGQHRLFLFVLEDDLPLFEFAKGAATLVPVTEAFRPPVKNIFWHQTALPRIVRKLQIDVLHVPSYRRMVWPRPCPRVATIHDLAHCVISNKYDAGRTLYGRVFARKLARRQDAIIAISNTTAWDISTYFRIPKDRIDVIYNGIDHDRFSPGLTRRAEQLTEGHFQPGTPFFLYVARLEHPGKNHIRLIESFSRFKFETGSNWKLVFAGTDSRGANLIHEAMAQSPCSRDIHYLGFPGDADLPELYRLADAFIYPSLYEGFGLPPLEAMACGCPVIASSAGGLGEVVEGAAHIINPDDADSLIAGMKAVACDPGLRDRLRQAGFLRAADFDWRKTAVATMDVLLRTSSAGRTNEALASK